MTKCKDCLAAGRNNSRPTPHPGPRCTTCHRLAKKASKLAAHARRVEKMYNLPGDAYWALYVAQGGKCAICQVATGASRNLAVDHDHSCCPTTPTCGDCTRSLLCGPCNRLLGYGRDNPEFFRRVAWYLENPPAQSLIIGSD